MPYKTLFKDRGDYLFVSIEGDESYASALHFWEDLVGKKTRDGFRKIMIVDQVSGRLSTIELHKLSEMISSLFIGSRIAFVDPKEETFEDNKFGETVILNRGGQIVKLFQSEEAALEWLL